MSGTVLRLLEPTHFVFTQVLAAAGPNLTVPVAQHIDASGYREAHVMVHILGTKWDDSANDDIQILVWADAWDPSSPQVLLVTEPIFPNDNGEGGPLVWESLNPNAPSGLPSGPYALFFKFTECPSMLTINLQVLRSGISVQGNNLEVTVFMELALKN